MALSGRGHRILLGSGAQTGFRTIRICYIIGQLAKGGAEKQLYELVRCIDRDKFSPVVISLTPGGYWKSKIQGLSIPVISLHRKRHVDIARLHMLVRLLRRIRPAIVHTYLSDANSYGRIAAIITRVPIIIASERNLPGIGNDKGRIQFFIDKLLAYFSQVIICNSLIASAALISDHSIDFRKVYTVHNGIDISPGKNSREKKWLGNQPVIGTIGRLYEQKNHKLFLETAKVLLQDPKLKTKLKFLIIGEGKLRQDLEVYADRCGIKSNVVFMGERGDIDNLLKEIDIFLMTSSFEGCSNAIMEAMLAGLPVVATDAGGNGELIIDGETGFICPKNDPGALASRIRMLLENRQIAKRIGNAANKRIIKNFGLEKMKNETQEIYLSTLSQKGLFNCFNENAKVGDIA